MLAVYHLAKGEAAGQPDAGHPADPGRGRHYRAAQGPHAVLDGIKPVAQATAEAGWDQRQYDLGRAGLAVGRRGRLCPSEGCRRVGHFPWQGGADAADR